MQKDRFSFFTSNFANLPNIILQKIKTYLLSKRCRLGHGSKFGPEADVNNNRKSTKYINIGKNTYCRGRLLLYGHGGQINIGDFCYIGLRTEIWSMQSIQIGNRVLIAHNVNIHDGTAHSKNADERHEHFKIIFEQGHPESWDKVPGVSAKPIVIEDDVWISFGATILQGVRIGSGSVISAGSVVTSDVPSGMVYQNKIQPYIKPLE